MPNQPLPDDVSEVPWEMLWDTFRCEDAPRWTHLDPESQEGFQQAFYFRLLPYMLNVVHVVATFDHQRKAMRN